MKNNFLRILFLLSIFNISYAKNITLDLNKDKTIKDDVTDLSEPEKTTEILPVQNGDEKVFTSIEEIYKEFGNTKEAVEYINKKELYHLMEIYEKKAK